MAGGQAFAGGRGAQGQITGAFLPSAHGGWSAMKKGAPENQQQCGVDSPRTSRKTIRSFKSRCSGIENVNKIIEPLHEPFTRVRCYARQMSGANQLALRPR